MKCHTCLQRACYITRGFLKVINWCCRLHSIKFGSDAEFNNGNKKMRKSCPDYLDKLSKEDEIIQAPVKIHKGIEMCKKALRK